MSTRRWFDLQAHSLHSDGELAPAEVVARAADAGIELFALTDHDSVAGVTEAVAEGKRRGVRVVPAVEISCVDEAAPDVHLLGYGINRRNRGLTGALARMRAQRAERAHAMADALRRLGLELDDRELQARERDGGSIGRPHLAAAVMAVKANAPRLRAVGLHDASDVFQAFLVPGAPAFVARSAPTVAEAIELVHQAGGVAVWAHPFWDLHQHSLVLAMLDRFVAAGLDGVEAFYVTHTEAQTLALAERCEELDLLTTGSSDFHGPSHARFSRFGAHHGYGLEPRLGPIA